MSTPVALSPEGIQTRLQQSAALHFLPYIGPDYCTAKPRMLVLGEASHGATKADSARSSISHTVQKALSDAAQNLKNNHWVHYIKNTAAMLTGEEYGKSHNIWAQLAYGVFFQTPYTDSAKDRKNISAVQLAQAQAAFSAMLDILAPQYVTVWGAVLFNKHWLPQENLLTLDPSLPVYAYKDYPDTLIWHSHHPARDFSYTTEHQRWLAVQETAKNSMGKRL